MPLAYISLGGKNTQSCVLLIIKRDLNLEKEVGKKEADETQDGCNLNGHTLDALLSLLSNCTRSALLTA